LSGQLSSFLRFLVDDLPILRMTMGEIVRIDSRVSDFLSKPRKLLINGAWVDAASGKKFAVENPATGDILSQVAHGEKADVDKAVSAARAAFDTGPWTTKVNASTRAKMIWKLADLIEAHTEEFAQLESLDNGKPLTVARAADVALSVDIFRYMAGWCTKNSGETLPLSVPYTPNTKYLAYTLKEPIGVIGQIIPWNFPLLMAAWKLAPALAAGCTVVLKPAEQTPLSALRLGELIAEAGIPDGVVNIVTGFGDAGARLVEHPLVDKVAFTGSTEVGRLIVGGAAPSMKRCHSSLGANRRTLYLQMRISTRLSRERRAQSSLIMGNVAVPVHVYSSKKRYLKKLLRVSRKSPRKYVSAMDSIPQHKWARLFPRSSLNASAPI
jgi:phenylacetaldehyde dehydrogenase